MFFACRNTPPPLIFLLSILIVSILGHFEDPSPGPVGTNIRGPQSGLAPTGPAPAGSNPYTPCLRLFLQDMVGLLIGILIESVVNIMRFS
jgi:hypothetical protein